MRPPPSHVEHVDSRGLGGGEDIFSTKSSSAALRFLIGSKLMSDRRWESGGVAGLYDWRTQPFTDPTGLGCERNRRETFTSSSLLHFWSF